VWLASVSLFDKKSKLISSNAWNARQMRHAQNLIDQALEGIGDNTRERRFRMCITLCCHRGVRDDELAAIPQWWHDAEAVDIAGGPLEVLSSCGVAEIPSAMPCYNPGKQPIARGRPDLWIPVDCGVCPPCMARKAVRTRGPLTRSAQS
jgi:hypothetical protein